MYTLQTQVNKNIFRAYDIRGIVDQDLSPDVVFTIGLALGGIAYAQGEKQFMIGRDGRTTGVSLSTALIAGIRASGCDVVDIGMVPTPLLYFATYTLGTGTGVMLTGSHNPPQYNGLKIMVGGETWHGDSITALYEKIIENKLCQRPEGGYQTHDIHEQYFKAITDHIILSRSFKIVVDCGNGVAGFCAPELLTRLGCEVIPLFCEIDGTFPNHHPDPMVPSNLTTLIDTVKKQHADFGLAFDGDGDRLGLVTEHGEIIWPDRQLLLFAQDVLKRYPGATIVYDVKCTRLLTTLIREQGGQPLMSPTGHSLIKAALKRTGAPLAGEMSGHVFFNDEWYGFDDALYCAARLLAILTQQTRSVSEVFAQFPQTCTTPEMPIVVSEEQKFSLIHTLQQQAKFPGAEISTIDGLRADYPNGWGLIRASNTTPTFVTRFEADMPETLAWIQEQFKREILTLAPLLKIPF